MKWYYLFGVLLLAVAWVQAEEESVGLQDITKDKDDDDDDVDIKEAVKELFTKKCKHAGGQELVDKATAAIDTAKICLGEHVPKNQDEFKDIVQDQSSSSEELCSEKRPKLRKCFSDFIDALKQCADEEEKYLPEFVFDAIDNLFDYVCADNGAIFTKVFEDSTLECVFDIVEKIDNITDPCDNKLQVLKDDTPEDIIITKSELCHDLSTAKTCYADFVKELCPKDKNLSQIVAEIIEAISSPCHKDPKNPLSLRTMRKS